MQPNHAAGSQQEHRPLSRHAEIGDHLSSTLSTDLLQAIFSLRATWLLSCDLSCSRPFACLCRGHSSVRVERPCKGQPHIAKTTHWYVQHSLFWAVVTCVHFLHQRRHANMSTTLCTRSCTDPESLLAWTEQEPLQLSHC